MQIIFIAMYTFIKNIDLLLISYLNYKQSESINVNIIYYYAVYIDFLSLVVKKLTMFLKI